MIWRWGVLLAFCTVLAAFLGAHGYEPVTNATDFRAFYCGGRVVAEHRDPYRVEPLRSCEQAVLQTERLQWIEGLVVPAPLPPYALALVGAIAWLPFVLASAFWCALSLVAWLRTVHVLRDLTGLPLGYVAVATCGLGFYVSFGYGQIVPLVLWCVVEAGARLRANQPRRAAALATFSLVEPHLGGPVFLALLLLRPEARRPLLAGLAALCTLSLVCCGPAVCIEWVVRALPAQGAAELRSPEQFGATTALAYLGATPALAALGGIVSYAIAVAAGIWTASRISQRWHEAAAVTLTPAAFAMAGGPYVHQHQLAAVAPIALLGYAKTGKPAYVVAFGLLAVPWIALAESFPSLQAVFWPWHKIVLPHVSPNALAATVWASFVATVTPTPQTIWIVTLVKLPFWLGIGCAVVPLVREALQPQRLAPRSSSAPGFEPIQ